MHPIFCLFDKISIKCEVSLLSKHYRMKKYLLITTAVLALAFTACKPGPKPEKEVTFQIEVNDITASEASVKVTPSDANVPYYFDVVSVEYYESFASDQALVVDYVAYFNSVIKEYAQYGYALTIDSFLSVGPDDYDFSGMSPETNYYVIAFVLDSTKTALKGNLTKVPFTTLEVQQVNLLFEPAMGDTAVLFIPSNDEITYFSTYIDADTLAATGYTAEQYFDAFATYVKGYYGEYFEYFFVLQGTSMVPFSELEAGHSYKFLAKAYEAGIFNSDLAIVDFTAPTVNAPALKVKGQMDLQFRMKKAKKIKIANDAFRARM